MTVHRAWNVMRECHVTTHNPTWVWKAKVQNASNETVIEKSIIQTFIPISVIFVFLSHFYWSSKLPKNNRIFKKLVNKMREGQNLRKFFERKHLHLNIKPGSVIRAVRNLDFFFSSWLIHIKYLLDSVLNNSQII